MPNRYIGQEVPRSEDQSLLTGSARFLADLVLPGVLHAVVVRSPYPHARVVRVEAGLAAGVDGTVGVYTGRDLRGHWAGPLPMIWPVTPDIKAPDHWPLTMDVARYQGDGVAVVLAESAAAAKDAADLVEVEYEQFPAVTSVEAAAGDGAPLVHPEFGTNRCYSVAYQRGDVDEAFASADLVVSRTIRQQRIIASPIEPRGALAQPTGPGDEFTLWTSSQVPHLVRRTIGACVGIPEHKLRVRAPAVGGAFGSKLNVYAEEALVLTLAMKSGRPVKWVEERSEAGYSTTHGRGQVQLVELAATSDGRIKAIRVSVLASMGAYLQLETPGIPLLGQMLFGGVYGADAYAYGCTGVFTNQTPTGAYRGVGRAEAINAIERIVDALAAETNLDPVEVRRRNFLPPGEVVWNAAGIPYDSANFGATLDRALELTGYATLREQQASRRNEGGGPQLGIGLACYVDSTGVGPSALLPRIGYQLGGWESARVRVLPTGKIEVFTGSSPQGQGHQTAWSQLVADAFGVDTADVRAVSGDTGQGPPGMGTYGSRSLIVGGTALHLASQKVLAKARKVAAHLLEAAEEDVAFEEGRFALAGTPVRSLSLPDVAGAAYAAHRLPAGLEPGLEAMAVYDPPDFAYTFGTHVAVVEVDPETGAVDLVRYVGVDDCGTVINPILVEGQIHGALAQGIGQALFEEAAYSEDGQLLTPSMVQYLMPGAAELPSFELDRTVTPSPFTPFGAKGVAEVGAIAAPPAVTNAVLDALAPLGVKDLDMPATPERVWRSIQGVGPS